MWSKIKYNQYFCQFPATFCSMESKISEDLLNSPEKTTSEGADRVELDAECLKRSYYLVDSFTGQSICVMKLVARPANVKELL